MWQPQVRPAPASPTARLEWDGGGENPRPARRFTSSHFAATSNARRLVDWVFGRRPHSTLPQSQRASNPVNAVRRALQKCQTASVGQRTNTRSTSTHTHWHTRQQNHSLHIQYRLTQCSRGLQPSFTKTFRAAPPPPQTAPRLPAPTRYTPCHAATPAAGLSANRDPIGHRRSRGQRAWFFAESPPFAQPA